jgi:integrase
MALSDARIKAAKPRQKPYKLGDSGGLYLLVKTTAAKLWRFKYRVAGMSGAKFDPLRKTTRARREKVLALGRYPAMSLALARKRRDEARELLADNKDPAAEKRAEESATANNFATVAEKYLQTRTDLAKRTLDKARWQLREFLNPEIGSKPIGEITAPELLAALRKIEATGKIETAHKSKELAGRVFMFAIASGDAERNPAADLKLALTARPDVHLAAITKPADVGKLLRAIDGYDGQPATHAALRLLPHIFLRPGEIRGGRWEEIDWDNTQWLVPAERMKGKKNKRREHLVPLSKQALSILKGLHEITGRGKFMFPAIGHVARPISENTLGAALRGLGYSSEVHTPHGWRSTASTLLHELGHLSADIELQLAHSDKNKVRGIYNRSERLAERRKMLQAYSDYLDSLRDGGNVVALKGKRARA